MTISIISLVAGFIVLIYGADQLVKGSSSIARKYGLSSLFIGLTIVAFGSSAPELVVNLFAAFQGQSEIAIGNVIGSNIANIFLGLGLAALVRPLVVERAAVWREIPFAILGGLMLLVLAADTWLGNGADMLTANEGIALLGFFLIFVYFTFKPMLNKRKESKKDRESVDVEKRPMWMSVLMIVGGLIGLVVGGHLIVNGATDIALALGISQALVTLTVVAAGTSLPEIAATVMAAYRGHTDMAIGNIIGSVTFNTLWILGLSSLVSPLHVYTGGLVDITVAFAGTLILFPFMINQKRVGHLDRWEGAIFFILYVAFIAFTIWRG